MRMVCEFVHFLSESRGSEIRGPGVALGLVTPAARAARAARTVLRGTSRGFAAVLMRGFAAN